MGEIADRHVSNFTSGRWGTPLHPQREYAKTTKAAIRDSRFSVVEVVGGRTNRLPGMKLVVCDQSETNYWVWASSGVTGIAKDVCKVLESDLSLDDALARRAKLNVSPRDQKRAARRAAAAAERATAGATALVFNDDI